MVHGFRDAKRMSEIALVLSEVGLGYWLRGAILNHIPFLKRVGHSFQRSDEDLPVRLRRAFERLGVTFIKFGQILSTRPDLIPKEWALEFGKLQDAVPPESWISVQKTIEEELKRPLRSIFKSFSKTPIASASIGQVYVGVLKNGKKVAVKVQRRNIESVLESDIDILLFLARELEKHYPETRMYNPVGIVEEFASWTRKEIDYTIEASHAEVFAKNFKGDKTVYVPRVVWDVSTKKVLVLDYVDGIKVSALSPERKKKYGSLLAKRVANMCLKQIFDHCFFHGDPHPANLFVTKENRIAMLDFGIVGQFSQQSKKNITRIFLGVVQGDSIKIAENFLALTGQSLPEKNYRAYLQDLEEFIITWSATASTKNYSSSRTFFDLISIGSHHGVQVPRDIVILGKTLLTVDTVARDFDKNFDFLSALKPYAEKMSNESFEPQNVVKDAKNIISELRTEISEIPSITRQVVNSLEKGAKVKFDEEELHSYEDEKRQDATIITLGVLFAGLVISGAVSTMTSKTFIGINMSTFIFSVAGIVLFLLWRTMKRNIRGAL